MPQHDPRLILEMLERVLQQPVEKGCGDFSEDGGMATAGNQVAHYRRGSGDGRATRPNDNRTR
jgi:hypothetical protein